MLYECPPRDTRKWAADQPHKARNQRSMHIQLQESAKVHLDGAGGVGGGATAGLILQRGGGLGQVLAAGTQLRTREQTFNICTCCGILHHP